MWNRYGHSSFSLIVGGKDLQLGNETVASATVNEDVKSLIPTADVVFLDDKLVSGGMGIFQDGAQVVMQMGDGKNGQQTFNLNQWSLSRGKATARGNAVQLHAIANLVPWMSQVISSAFKGNASDVVQQIGQKAGISLFDISGTNDKMTWLPDGRTMGNFARKVMDHAWMGQGSAPHMAITSQNGQWMMRVKDIMKGGSSGANFVSYGLSPDSSSIPIIDYNIESHSGTLNQYTTYGHKVVQEMLNGKVNVFQNFTFNSLAGVSGISSSLQQLVRTFYHSPESGNTHDNYAQALHQNIMGRSTFSAMISILTDFQTTVKLMDDVSLLLANTDGSVNSDYSGTYKVANISRTIQNGHYLEKILVATQGAQSSS